MNDAPPAAGYVPAAVPDVSGLTDSGRWREAGVTGWRLVLAESEIRDDDRQRYSATRWGALLAQARTEPDPRAALDWVVAQRLAVLGRAPDPVATAQRAGWHDEAAWVSHAAVTWWVMTHAVGYAGGGVALTPGRAVEIFAVPMLC